ncbi:MAG: ribosome biogenesis GTP-binding protein YihA/YsxC [Syntrophobacterales bacterium]|nr:ribosome biogenesis GTP-binding protein YihA/YsxC [Syntrophobacterales bacterium]
MKAEFVKSAARPDHFTGEDLPEVAFVGRSNSGKSTLINALTGQKRLAKASNSPGRTQLIQFFLINGSLSFADLPGYGYAKVPESIRSSWRPMIETYLRVRANLCLVVLVADIRRDITNDELLLIDWLTQYERAVLVVLSKTDKLSANEQALRMKKIRKALSFLPPERICPYSAKTGKGREQIWQSIGGIVQDFTKPAEE